MGNHRRRRPGHDSRGEKGTVTNESFSSRTSSTPNSMRRKTNSPSRCRPPTMSSAAHSSKAPMRSTPSSPPSNNRIYTTNKQRFAIHDTSAKQNILSINVITEKTMRHIFKLLAASVAAATICSCSSLTGYPTDAEASYAKAIEIAKRASTPTSSRSIRFRSWRVKPCRTTCSSSR